MGDIKCLVSECFNRSSEGYFVGNLCGSCHSALFNVTSGGDINERNFIERIPWLKDKINKLENRNQENKGSMKLWNNTQDLLIDLIFDSPEVRSLVISKLSKLKESNTKIIPSVHEKLNELSENNSKLFAALKLIPEDPTLVGKIEDFKLEKAALKDQIKQIAETQLKLKYLIKTLQTKSQEQ